MVHTEASPSPSLTPRVLVVGPGDGSSHGVARALESCPTIDLVGPPAVIDSDRDSLDASFASVVVVVARYEDSTLWRTVMGFARPPISLPVVVVGPEALRTTAFLTGAEDWIPLDLEDAADEAHLIRSVHNAVIRRRVAGGLPTNGHLHGLVTGIAHEVNNPLTVINADLEDACERLAELRDKTDDPALTDELTDLAEMLGEDQQAARRIGALTRGLQNLARLADTVPSPLHTGPAVRRVLRRLGEANPNAPAPVVRGATEQRVHGSVHGFEEALFNILQNAQHAHAMAAVDQPIEVDVVGDTDHVEFRIRDHGGGVRSDLIGHELSPFVTGREPGEGLGLGLTVAALAVRRAGGDLTIQAHPEGGTEVRIGFLPARRRRAFVLDDEEELAAR